jgi:hypothetical protein
MQERAPGSLNLTPLEDQLIRESTAMASYALASGKHLPPRVAEILQSAQLARQLAPDSVSVAAVDPPALTWAHAQLTRLVAPAAPRAVLLLAEQSGHRGRWGIFGPIPLVRYLLAIALISMLGLLFIGATEQVSLTTVNIFNLVGLASILNSLFLLCAASLGASFSGLFRINLYIAATTYDPKYDASYWVQYGLGVIAGVLLGTLIPLADATAGSAITRPVLALVGGFSASVLYRLMDRLSRSIESMVAGGPTDASPPQPMSQLVENGADGGPPRTTEELVVALRQLVTALSQNDGPPNGHQELVERREKQLPNATTPITPFTPPPTA